MGKGDMSTAGRFTRCGRKTWTVSLTAIGTVIQGDHRRMIVLRALPRPRMRETNTLSSVSRF